MAGGPPPALMMRSPPARGSSGLLQRRGNAARIPCSSLSPRAEQNQSPRRVPGAAYARVPRPSDRSPITFIDSAGHRHQVPFPFPLPACRLPLAPYLLPA